LKKLRVQKGENRTRRLLSEGRKGSDDHERTTKERKRTLEKRTCKSRKGRQGELKRGAKLALEKRTPNKPSMTMGNPRRKKEEMKLLGWLWGDFGGARRKVRTDKIWILEKLGQKVKEGAKVGQGEKGTG